MEAILTLLVMLLVLVLSLLWDKTRRRKEWPPGPPTIPFLGNLNVNLNDVIGEFRKFRQQYGDVFSLVLGCKTVVVVNGLDTMKELFIKNADVVSERADTIVTREITRYEGIMGSSGLLWKEHRAFVLSTLRNYGFEKLSMEGKITEELEVFVECLKGIEGKTFSVEDLLHTSVSNITCSITFGERYQHHDGKFIALINSISETFRTSTINGAITFFPFLKCIPGDPVGYCRVKENMNDVSRHLKSIIDEHKKSPVTDAPTNYLDAYLKHQSELKNNQSTFTDSQLHQTLKDIFIPGSDTTCTVLKWFILVMLHKPEIQQRMRHEILEVVGSSRLPSLKDRENLPYSEAVLHETLRFGNISPLSLPHGLTRDLQFKGYAIPKDAMIIPCLDSILNDPELFKNPSEFQPSRFLSEDGSLIGTDKIYAFGIGRRICPGESLARMELFLFATTLIQKFRLIERENEEIPSLSEYILGVSRWLPSSLQIQSSCSRLDSSLLLPLLNVFFLLCIFASS